MAPMPTRPSPGGPVRRHPLPAAAAAAAAVVPAPAVADSLVQRGKLMRGPWKASGTLRRWMASRKSAILVVVALAAAIGAIPGGSALAAAGPDLRVSLAGNFPTGPNSAGNFGVDWSNVGTANITGFTHVTVDLPTGLTTPDG